MKIAVYPGSFDPITNGHLNIVERSTKIFDKLIVAVAVDSKKSTLFSAQKRTEMIREATKKIEKVEVKSFSGLLTDFVRKNKANIIIRGMRAISDFEHESQLALMNKRLAPEIETIFMVTCAKYSYLNSSIVKEIASLNGKISQLVPEIVEERLNTLFFNKKLNKSV
ncbi:Phosphopantetheine adenylyltransferase [subsurface metagenome]